MPIFIPFKYRCSPSPKSIKNDLMLNVNSGTESECSKAIHYLFYQQLLGTDSEVYQVHTEKKIMYIQHGELFD